MGKYIPGCLKSLTCKYDGNLQHQALALSLSAASVV